jgi:hypothetical protein
MIGTEMRGQYGAFEHAISAAIKHINEMLFKKDRRD